MILEKVKILLGLEVWKPVPNYEGRIWVSNRGRAKGVKRVLKLQPNRLGYFRIETTVKGRRARMLIHQAVAQAFIKNCRAEAREVDHLDRDKGNNNIKNLNWVTRIENEQRKRERMKRDEEIKQNEIIDDLPF